jgi:predicted 2-oxoglutarate/Fe(II)-dependent dioxygenase YbiX
MNYLDQLWSPTVLFRHPGFLSVQECIRIRDHMLFSPTYTGLIIKRRGAPTVDTKVRRATNVEVPDHIRGLIDQRLAGAQSLINGHFSLQTCGRQQIQFLIYGSGEFFRRHRDVAPESNIEDLRARKISVVVFLNDSHTTEHRFQGGVLSFIGRFQGESGEITRLDVEPEEGLLIAFPPDLLHEVIRVKRGLRFTLVSWFT